MISLFPLLLISQIVVEGEFGSESGQWAFARPSILDGELLLPSRSKCFIVGNGLRVIDALNDVLCVSHYRDGYIISGMKGTKFFNSNLTLDRHDETSIFTHLSRTGDSVYGTVATKPGPQYFKLIRDINSNVSLFRRPTDNLGHKAWVAKRNNWLMIYWSGTPDRIFVSGPIIDRFNSDRTEPGKYPFLKLPSHTPQPPARKTYLLKDRPFILTQELLGTSKPVLFDVFSKGYVVCREIGVKAPLKKTLFIGSQVEVMFLDFGGELIQTRFTHGQIVGVDNDKLVILHNGRITPSPLERWHMREESPNERANIILSDFKRRNHQRWEVFLEYWDWPEP
ncbi:MAG: hypothetical protein QNK37_15105 [Acidobacteriota bacterium]|nr:hypothetical protein [Acidobacteriota bacterium]